MNAVRRSMTLSAPGEAPAGPAACDAAGPDARLPNPNLTSMNPMAGRSPAGPDAVNSAGKGPGP